MRALVLYNENGSIQPRIETLPEDRLPEGDLLLEVHYSSLNYKDALAVTGKGKSSGANIPSCQASTWWARCSNRKTRTSNPDRR